MKKLLILFSLLSFSLLGAAEIKSTAIADIGLTSGIFSGLKASLGRATIWEHKSTELTLNYKADLEITFDPQLKGEYVIHNAYLKWNRFFNPQRSRSFFLLKGGVFALEVGDWLGTEDSYNFALPTFSLGYGYSFRLKDNSFIRTSIDLGFQVNILNIELAYLFDL
ncbi:MAG: hypothetical protein R6U84_10645 [Candidatus Cloacimonadales bacterium]